MKQIIRKDVNHLTHDFKLSVIKYSAGENGNCAESNALTEKKLIISLVINYLSIVKILIL